MKVSQHGHRLGRLPSPPKHLARLLRLSDYLDLPRILPSIPSSYSYPASYQTPMYLNDQLGDCTAAAIGHVVGQNSLESSKSEIIFADQQIKSFYFQTSGGVDQGADMGTTLKLWQSQGIIGPSSKPHKAIAYAALNQGDRDQLRAVIWLFKGAAYVGASLPDRVVPSIGDWSQIPWTGNAGSPNSGNGHAFAINQFFGGDQFTASTWGQRDHPMDGAFYAEYVDEPYLVLTEDLLSGGVSPDGFDLAALLEDVKDITGGVTPPPPPPPQPNPDPPGCLSAPGVAHVVKGLHSLINYIEKHT